MPLPFDVLEILLAGTVGIQQLCGAAQGRGRFWAASCWWGYSRAPRVPPFGDQQATGRFTLHSQASAHLAVACFDSSPLEQQLSPCRWM